MEWLAIRLRDRETLGADEGSGCTGRWKSCHPQRRSSLPNKMISSDPQDELGEFSLVRAENSRRAIEAELRTFRVDGREVHDPSSEVTHQKPPSQT